MVCVHVHVPIHECMYAMHMLRFHITVCMYYTVGTKAMMKELERRFLSGDFHPRKKRALKEITNESQQKRKKSNPKEVNMLPTGNILVISLPPNDSYQLDEPSFEVEHQGSECQPHQGSDYGVKDMSINTSTDDVTSVRSVKSGTSSESDLDSPIVWNCY